MPARPSFSTGTGTPPDAKAGARGHTRVRYRGAGALNTFAD